MFENLLRTINSLDGRRVSVPISSDAEGYFDRACPSDGCLFEFKVHEEDWRNKVTDAKVFCPFCRHAASSDQWWTEAQSKHALQAVRNQINDHIHGAMKRDADRWNQRQLRNSFLRITMSVANRPRHIPLPPVVAEQMELKIRCPACGCRYAVVGAAYFCPACGHNSVERDFLSSIRTQLASLDVILAVRKAVNDRDVAENTIRTIIESGLLNAVMAFQRYVEALYLRGPNSSVPRRNAFQNLNAGDDLWLRAFGRGFKYYLGATKFETLNRYFQQRHLLAHTDGIVDANYCERTGDVTYAEGQRIVVKEEDVRRCLALVEELVRALETDLVERP